MSFTLFFGIMTIVFACVGVLGVIFDNCDALELGIYGAIGGFVIFLLFAIIELGVLGVINDELGAACESYCEEQGYSYDSIEREMDSNYCVCDSSIRRFLITEELRVIIGND